MSHFTVLIIGEDIEGKLAPYDENLEVALHMAEADTREEREWERKELIEEAKNSLQDSTMDYSKYTDKLSLADFVKEFYGEEIDADGNILTTYNPKSKWDWYRIGGRWNGMLKLQSGTKANQLRLNQLDPTQKLFGNFGERFFTYAVIAEDGAWHEVGEMGWSGESTETDEEREEWKKTYWDKFIKGLPGDTLLTVVDCHI